MTIDAVIERIQRHTPVVSRLGFRVWTRGDGARNKDPTTLVSADLQHTWTEIEKLFPTATSLEVSGELSSSPYDPAIITSGVVLIQRDTHIQVSSKSILKNSIVWRSRPRHSTNINIEK